MSDEPAEKVNRVPLSMKIAPDVRARLLEEAESKGHTLTQEAEFRLRQSFDLENLLGDIRCIVAEEITVKLEAFRSTLREEVHNASS